MQSRITVLCLTALAAGLVGCGDKKEALCRSSAVSQLLNPETAEFYDVKRMTPAQAVDYALPEPSPLTTDEKAMPTFNQIQILEDKKEVTQKRLNMLNQMNSILDAKPDVEFYAFRIRAEGELGNKVTKQSICIYSADECSCTIGSY
ncbi:hypothetical protein [Sphingobium sp. ba1]|uniref:hypothetical protein n=1 Tax=Sphingobium sp. ba1 TaxID=1522072 RepID=UPI0012E00817|nr:hypothetical protein [Sphingobium sp. ba1]